MITSLKAFTKSAGLIAWPPITKENANDIPVLSVPIHPNLSGSNKKKTQSWRRSNSRIRCAIHCHYTVNEKRLMYRRQLLLSSTLLPLKPQEMMEAMTPPLSLTDYHKLANTVQEAEKLKGTSYSSPEINDVICWLSSPEPLKTPNSKSPDELTSVIAIAVPRGQEFPREINQTEVVTAGVRKAGAFKLMKEKEEQLVLEGIEVTNEKPLCFDVYIKLGQEDDEEEELYAGTFSHMPPRRKQRGRHNNKHDFHGDSHEQKRTVRRCCLRLGINDILVHRHNLKAHQEERVIVKLVPIFKLDEDPIKVESIFIHYT